ncbi:glucose transporter type 1-like [Parasteatoda tepidariorum]|uniref:glucose transporter type 1-like n=1 Tax=Parasteatoda tepidariorum TaxID=114398 RepID=UPI00077F80D5|nr:glucose transporter type 1-like [Parasteatoda tepidariorum]
MENESPLPPCGRKCKSGEDVELVARVSTPELEYLPAPSRMTCCPEGLTCMLVFSIFAAVLGMFQFGYNTGVTNAPQIIIKKFIEDVYRDRTGADISNDFRDLLWSLIVSVFAVGGMIGGMIGGSLADKFGRKGGLLVNNGFGIIGAALMGSSKISQSIEILVVGRLIIGMNCGVNSALVPMYLSEISPLTLRGGLGTVNQLGITIGLLLSQVLGIQAILGTERGWPFLFGISVIPAVLQLLILPLCPESPRYLLISKQQESLAREALQKLRCSSLVEEDIDEMKAEDRTQLHEPETAFTEEFRIQPPPMQITIWKLLQTRSLHLPLVIGVVMQLTQQLSGINAVLYYSTGLFMGAGLPENAAKYATIGVGVVMLIMTLISIPLMDRKGRRTLQLYGLGGMFIFSIFITITMLVKFLYHWIAYFSVASTLCFVIFYAMGPGPIPWMITAELFSQGPRPAAMSIAVTVNWFANFVVSLVFPQMQRVFENYTFLVFTMFLAVFWTFTYKKIPETKNKTFEEISALFRRDDDPMNINGMNVLQNSLQSPEMLYEDKPLDQCEFHHRHHCRLRNMPGGPHQVQVQPNHVEDAL